MSFKKSMPILYYALLAVLGITLLCLGLADTQNTGDKYKGSSSFDVEQAFRYDEALASRVHYSGTPELAENRDYILKQLANMQIPTESVTVKEHEVVYDGTGKELRDPYPIYNIIVDLPGASSEQTLLVMAHYDSVAMGPGAGDDIISVAGMLETLRQISKNGTIFRNRVVFLFTDSEERGLDGSRFAWQKDLDAYKANGQLKLVTNFECRGTAGSLIMFETGKKNSALIKELGKIDGGFYTNSMANFVYNNMPNYTDLTTFLDQNIAGLNFANIGEGYNYHTQNDNTDNLDKSLLAQIGTTMGSVLNHFGNMDLTKIYEAKANAVFFNYLDWFTVSYSTVFALVVGIVILGMIAAIFLINRDTKVYSYKKFGIGMAVLGIALVLTVLILMLFNLIMKIFGVYGSMVNSGLYASMPLLLAVLFICSIVCILVYHYLGKLLRTDAKHITLAGSCLIGFLGAILAFAMPELSFLLMWTGFFALAGCLVHTIFGEKGSLHRISLPLAGLILTIPVAVGILQIAGEALGAKMYPVIGVLAALFLSLLLPHASQFEVNFTRPALSKIKLNRFVAVIVMGIAAFSLLLADGIGTPARSLSANLYGQRTEYYDDTMTFVHDSETSADFAYLFDFDIYPYVKKEVGKFERDSSDKTYSRAISGVTSPGFTSGIAAKKLSSGEKSVYKFTITGLGATVDTDVQVIFPIPVISGVPVYYKIEGVQGYGTDLGIPYTGKEISEISARFSKDTVLTVTYMGDVTLSQFTYKEIHKDADFIAAIYGATPEYRAAREIPNLRLMAEIRKAVNFS